MQLGVATWLTFNQWEVSGSLRSSPNTMQERQGLWCFLFPFFLQTVIWIQAAFMNHDTVHLQGYLLLSFIWEGMSHLVWFEMSLTILLSLSSLPSSWDCMWSTMPGWHFVKAFILGFFCHSKILDQPWYKRKVTVLAFKSLTCS